ncbi:LL-diaminopimelate aminotransferase [bacterium]|nr:LL-diaminopimelate aminotransferase [bacterium]
MKLEKASRLNNLPPYLFAKIDEMKQKAMEEGVDIIDLGIGDPDLPTPGHIIQRLYEAAKDPANHRYASYNGLRELREAIAKWYERRFQVKLDPESEILPLVGSKEGIGHIPLAFINEGDIVLVPDPGYPVYRAGTVLSGGEPYFMPLLSQNGFLPDLSAISEEIARKAKLMFLNYPNNPTTATASEEFFREVVRFAQKFNIVICHDGAYSEVTFDGYRAPSFLEVEGAKEVGIEFHSLSKTYNMTGWRIGFAVGSREVLANLLRVKTNLDSGIFQAIQYAGIEALTGSEDETLKAVRVYRERRDTLVESLKELGWQPITPKATFYVWIPVPNGCTSMEFVSTLLRKAGIVTTPGVGFGEYGEGFIRVALTVPRERIKEAVERIRTKMPDIKYKKIASR